MNNMLSNIVISSRNLVNLFNLGEKPQNFQIKKTQFLSNKLSKSLHFYMKAFAIKNALRSLASTYN